MLLSTHDSWKELSSALPAIKLSPWEHALGGEGKWAYACAKLGGPLQGRASPRLVGQERPPAVSSGGLAGGRDPGHGCPSPLQESRGDLPELRGWGLSRRARRTDTPPREEPQEGRNFETLPTAELKVVQGKGWGASSWIRV